MDTDLNPDPGEDPELVQLMDQEIQTKRTREELESDNEENPISKQPKNQEAGWRKPEEQHPTTSKNTTNMKVGQENPVILIQLIDDKTTTNFNNPIKLTKALNTSEFHKYIIEDSLRVLGTGKALRFEINDLSKIKPLREIKKLGEWNITCKQPTSNKNANCSYGTIYPVEPELKIENIKEKIRTLGNTTNEIIEVIRLKKLNKDKNSQEKWFATKSLRITFSGFLPERIAIGHTSYKVRQYTFPIIKCYNCLRYGHGIVTCKNKMRCSKCSQHGHKISECENNPYCFFCDEEHFPNNIECKKHREAQEINKENITPNNFEIKKQLQQLKPEKKNKNNQNREPMNRQPSQIIRSQSEEENNLESYAQKLTQPQSLTLGQKTPAKPKEQTPTRPRSGKTNKNQGNTSPKRYNKNSSEENKTITNSEQREVTESPTTWSLPTPIQYKENKKNNKEDENDNFSWIKVTKSIFKIITNLINNFNSEKPLMQNIIDIINEISLVLKDIIAY